MRKKKLRKAEKVKFTGIFIPVNILLMKNISLIEKLIMSDIGHFRGNGYRFSNAGMAKKFNVSRRTIINAVKRLKSPKLHLITDVGPDDYHRRLQLNGEISAPFEKTKGAKTAPVKTSEKYPQSSDEYRLSKLLLDLIIARAPDFNRPDLQKWAKHIDLMIRINHRTPEAIEKVIRWCQADAFWQNNILSTAKLRKQFDQLYLKLRGQNGHENRNARTADKRVFAGDLR